MEIENDLKKTKIGIYVISLVAFLALAITVGSYFLIYSEYQISTNPEKWGVFGDYIGGLMNPVIGLLALVALLWTIHQNQKELFYAREELKRSSKALEENNEISKKQADSEIIKNKKEEIQKIIDITYQELKRMLDGYVAIGIGISRGEREISTPRAKGGALINMEEKKLSELLESYSWINEYVLQMASLTYQLKEYLEAYESVSSEVYVPDYYKKYFIDCVAALENHGFVDCDTAEYFKNSAVVRGRVKVSLERVAAKSEGKIIE